MARSPGTSRKTKGARPRPTSAAGPDLAAAIVALRDEIAVLRRDVAQQSETVARARLDEIPRAEDFQPLADHLYEFAQAAPALLESLEAVRRSVNRVEVAARSLTDVADTLVATHESWTQSLMRLPRAEDYEPLVEPLREFARVSPALAETLAAVVRAVTPLPALVEPLLDAAEARRPRARDEDPPEARAALERAAAQMASARAAIEAALATLPRERSYAAAAAHLREIATVSPSLMEWMRQLPTLSLPLGESVAALERAVADLGDAEQEARRASRSGA